MKNIIIVFLLILWGWYFYDLLQDNKSLENAKKEMWIIEDNSSDKLETKGEAIVIDIIKPSYNIDNLDSKDFIKIDNLDSKIETLKDKIKITWKVLNPLVDKIVVNFRNTSSDFPNDRYELAKFKVWDNSFEYNANSKLFRNIDYWKNEYLIESYIWDEISKIQLNINIPENLWKVLEKEKIEDSLLNERVTYDKKIIGTSEDALYIGMPISDSFWKPLSLWNWEIIYSNISWLNIKKSNFSVSELENDNIWKSDSTWYLNKNVESSYVYWNTYRNIDNDNKQGWISFYVLRKQADEYIYEKYYFDFNHSIKWVLEIKRFDVSSDNISVEMSELNNTLKKQNDDFETVKITDKLFKEIIR